VKEIESILDDNQASDTILDKITSLDYAGPHDPDLPINSATFLREMSDIGFNWHEDVIIIEQDEIEAINKIKQLVHDFKNANEYTRRFYTKVIYSKLLNDENYEVQEVKNYLEANDIEQAKKQADVVRKATPRHHPQHPELTLDDVILIMEIIDSSGRLIASNSVVNGSGAYFNPA
jgi:hypothetical protein